MRKINLTQQWERDRRKLDALQAKLVATKQKEMASREALLADIFRMVSGGVKLSVREQQVLNLVKENLQNKEIAAKLGISVRTAKFHVGRLLRKFGVDSRRKL